MPPKGAFAAEWASTSKTRRQAEREQIPPDYVFQQPDLMTDFRERSGDAGLESAARLGRIFPSAPAIKEDIAADKETGGGDEIVRPIVQVPTHANENRNQHGGHADLAEVAHENGGTELLLVAADFIQQHVGVDRYCFYWVLRLPRFLKILKVHGCLLSAWRRVACGCDLVSRQHRVSVMPSTSLISR
jgi:hypothetical protein